MIKLFLKYSVTFIVSFILTFIVLLFVSGDLKIFVGTVQGASFPFSLTLKVLEKEDVEQPQRGIAFDKNQKLQNDNICPAQSNMTSNTNLLFVLIGLFVLIVMIVIMIYSYTFSRGIKKDGGSGNFVQMLRVQKSLEEKIESIIGRSFRTQNEKINNYANENFSDISQKIELLSSQYQRNSVELIKKTLERSFDTIENLIEQIVKTQVKKKDMVFSSKNPGKQEQMPLLNLETDQEKLQKLVMHLRQIILEADRSVQKLNNYLRELNQFNENKDDDEQKKSA